MCYVGGMKRSCLVVVPATIKPKPSTYEITAAYLLAEYFGENVEFVERNNQKTPDFKIDGRLWELKSPTGNGKHNIQHTLQRAALQSENIIFDARRSRIHANRLKGEILRQLKLIKTIKRLILIERSGKVVAIIL